MWLHAPGTSPGLHVKLWTPVKVSAADLEELLQSCHGKQCARTNLAKVLSEGWIKIRQAWSADARGWVGHVEDQFVGRLKKVTRWVK